MRKSAHNREEGTVLLSTLLVLTLMSAVALALMGTVRQSVDRTITLNETAQADLYLSGARDFATAQIGQLSGADPAALNAQLATMDPIVLPFENGAITLRVLDGTHCFRLSSLSGSNGVASDAARQQFEDLMIALGLDDVSASRIAATATDWVDADSQALPGGAEDGPYLSRPDPHRTANVPMVSVTELRALEGMTEPLFRTLLPHICIGQPGVPTPFNLDAAQVRHLPVLTALLGGDAAFARTLLDSRPPGGFGGSEALEASTLFESFDNPAVAPQELFTFGPQRVTVEVAVRFGSVERLQLLAFEGVDSGRPVLSYRSWGAEEFPSLIWARSASDGPESETGEAATR